LCLVLIAEIVMQILSLNRPMIRERVLDATTSCPTGIRFGKIYRVGDAVIEVRIRGVIDVAVGEAARAVKQESANRRDTDSAPNRAQPLKTFMREQKTVRRIR